MSTSFKLPEPADLDADELIIFNLIQGRGGRLRASKPTVDKNEPITGKAAYVWRLVAFMVSTKSAHHCMPVTADFDLPAYDESGKWCCRAAHQMADSLNPLIKKITDAIPLSQSHGAVRWGRALGMI
jgi:hypothetical protein